MESVGIRIRSDRISTSLQLRNVAAVTARVEASSSSPSLCPSSNIGTDRVRICNRARLLSEQPPPAPSPLCRIGSSGGKDDHHNPRRMNKSRHEKGEQTAVTCESIDRWVNDSVQEIVRNLRKAPLLVHVYNNESGSTTVKTEKAVEEEWLEVIAGWDKKESPVPEGLIFVDELEDEDEDEDVDVNDMYNSSSCKAWGIIVQGRGGGGGGVDCGGRVCYLLKTSKVGSGGVGLHCTHFCLKKVSNFRETTRSQFKNLWLVSAHA